jgi:hypothetical protein
MVQEIEGRTIQPLISMGTTIIPPGYAMTIRTPPVWNGDENEELPSPVAGSDGKGNRFPDDSKMLLRSNVKADGCSRRIGDASENHG